MRNVMNRNLYNRFLELLKDGGGVVMKLARMKAMGYVWRAVALRTSREERTRKT
jgi:hypothetical protein